MSKWKEAYKDLVAAVYGEENVYVVSEFGDVEMVFQDAADYIRELEGALAETEQVLELAEDEIDEMKRGPDELWHL